MIVIECSGILGVSAVSGHGKVLPRGRTSGKSVKVVRVSVIRYTSMCYCRAITTMIVPIDVLMTQHDVKSVESWVEYVFHPCTMRYDILEVHMYIDVASRYKWGHLGFILKVNCVTCKRIGLYHAITNTYLSKRRGYPNDSTY